MHNTEVQRSPECAARREPRERSEWGVRCNDLLARPTAWPEH